MEQRMGVRGMPGFKDIVGHEQIVEHLQNAIRMNKVSHAYLFEGEDGCGKSMTAGIFAAALQCEKGGPEPCGVCKSCQIGRASCRERV